MFFSCNVLLLPCGIEHSIWQTKKVEGPFYFQNPEPPCLHVSTSDPYRLPVQVWEIVAEGYNDLDSRRQLALIGLGSCWVLLFALLVMASLSVSGV